MAGFLNRRRSRRDTAETAIVDYLKAAGWSVLKLSVRNGPDLAAGKHGTTVLIECKTGKGQLSAGQVKWGQDWQGDPPYVLRTVEEAMALTRAINKLRRQS